MGDFFLSKLGDCWDKGEVEDCEIEANVFGCEVKAGVSESEVVGVVALELLLAFEERAAATMREGIGGR